MLIEHVIFFSDNAMDWRAISRSRSRIAMDWRATSRSRSRPPPGQPFDQGNVSSSWSEGKFNFHLDGTTPSFGNPENLSKSFDASYISQNEYATSSSIPIPGLASQLRYGSPPPSSSLQSHTAHLASVFEEGGLGLPPPSFMNFDSGRSTGSGGGGGGPSRLPDPFRRPSSSMNSPLGFQPSSLPSGGIHAPGPSTTSSSSTSTSLRQRPSLGTLDLHQQQRHHHHHQGNLVRHLRKTSFDHTVARSGLFPHLGGGGHSRLGSDELIDPLDPILVRIFISFHVFIYYTNFVSLVFYFLFSKEIKSRVLISLPLPSTPLLPSIKPLFLFIHLFIF